jgi:hypothetical protein
LKTRFACGKEFDAAALSSNLSPDTALLGGLA